MHQWSCTVPDFDSIINAQSRGQRRRHEEPTIWRPLAMGGVRCVNGAHFLENAPVDDINLAGKITETS
jgi:hypothetical protein